MTSRTRQDSESWQAGDILFGGLLHERGDRQNLLKVSAIRVDRSSGRPEHLEAKEGIWNVCDIRYESILSGQIGLKVQPPFFLREVLVKRLSSSRPMHLVQAIVMRSGARINSPGDRHVRAPKIDLRQQVSFSRFEYYDYTRQASNPKIKLNRSGNWYELKEEAENPPADPPRRKWYYDFSDGGPLDINWVYFEAQAGAPNSLYDCELVIDSDHWLRMVEVATVLLQDPNGPSPLTQVVSYELSDGDL